jgi:hypothetical protein
MIVTCPTCGAPVEFRFDDSFVRVCGSCRSGVVRTDRGPESLGQFADLVSTVSPLRLFAEGRYGSMSFLLVGMAQLRHSAGGLWQEWYCRLDGGAWAWLSEAQGRYYLTFEKPGLPHGSLDTLVPGQQFTLAGTAYTVAEAGTATYVAALGEIPFRLTPGDSYRFIDAGDGQGGFATVDFSGDAPAIYVGHQVSLAELGLSGGEDAPAPTAPRQGAKLACPNCNGALELRAPDRTLRIGCPYCGSLVDVSEGRLSVLAAADSTRPPIKLGSTCTFSEGELTVIGYLKRSANVMGSWYPFDEYLLYRPGLGFRWLVESDGHWNYVQPIAPGAVEEHEARYDGVKFQPFQRALLRVDRVVGEFYWEVQVDELVESADYIAPPYMLSSERSPTEQTWSLSTYVERSEVKRAFAGQAIDLPARLRIALNQPYPLAGIKRVALLAIGALLLVGAARLVTAKNQVVHTQNFSIPPVSSPPTDVPAETVAPNVVFSDPFELPGGKNLEVELTAQLENNWAYFAVDVVNETTGKVMTFDQDLEFYSGIEDGESWSEGSMRETHALPAMAKGTYIVRLEALQGALTDTPIQLTVRQDVVRGWWFLGACGVLGLPLLALLMHAFSFTRKRWEDATESTPAGAY